VDRVTDVLLTHHHRDQLQGLARAAAAGIRIWAPPGERGLIEDVDRHWLARPLDNDYDLRDDRFSLLEPVAVTGAVAEYRTRRYGAFDVYTLPTPGHTVGSVSYLVEVEGRRLAFTGDLLYGEGKVWSLAATQWTYTGTEGQITTTTSPASTSCVMRPGPRPGYPRTSRRCSRSRGATTFRACGTSPCAPTACSRSVCRSAGGSTSSRSIRCRATRATRRPSPSRSTADA